jgi:uncharacterized protein (DUF2336 family)
MRISSTSSRRAIARRSARSRAVSGSRRRFAPRSLKSAAASALELIENPYAELAPFSWDRIVERHGHLAAIRESMLVLEDLPSATRAALVAKLSETLAQFVVARNWLSADRAGRIASEARDRSTMHIAARSRGEDMRGLVQHLRVTGQLTAGLILRALLSGNLELFDTALAELADMPQARVSALLHDRGGANLHALLRRAGLPETTFAAFGVALEVCRENGFADTIGNAARLRRKMVERVLTHCETDRGAAEPLMILLRRFATESARDEARLFCDELVAEDAIVPDLIAA